MQTTMLKHKLIVVLFSCLIVLAIAACGNSSASASTSSTPSSSLPTSTPTHAATATPSPTPMPMHATVAQFKVTGVDMAVNPTSIAGIPCGKYITVTYTATFHVAPNSPGGTVQFQYTVNNGRGTTSASLSFGPGETTKTYSFTWSGNLPADHTYPGPGGVMVTSPNSLISQMVAPSGMCS